MIQSVVYSKQIIISVNLAVQRCVNVLFPSLFGFMVVSDFLIRSNLYSKLSVIFYPIAKFIFRMPAELFLIFLLSNIGGYPVGIKLLSQLYENKRIDKITAENMSVFCYSSGPSFIVGVIGISVFQSVSAGLIVYFSCFISNCISALFISYTKGYSFLQRNSEIKLSSENLFESISESGKKLLNICLTVIAFSYVLALLDCVNAFDFLKTQTATTLVKSCTEITNIVGLNNNYNLLPIVSSIASIGGICVLLQTINIKNKNIRTNKFLLSRIPLAVLSGIITKLLLVVFPQLESCSTAYYFQKSDSGYNIFTLICLFFMIIIIFFQKKGSNLKNNVL